MALDVDDLLRILLVLVIAWVALQLAAEVLEFVLGPVLGLLQPVIGLVVVALVALWLLDRL